MLISFKHKFAFIHIPKTGGMSITSSLHPFCGPFGGRLQQQSGKLGEALDLYKWGYLLRNRKYVDLHKFFPWRRFRSRHITALDLREALSPELFQNFFTFAFVRNPYSWIVSDYYYIMSHPSNENYEKFNALFDDFEEYVRWRTNRTDSRIKRVSKPIKKDLLRGFVTDWDDKIIVDFVGKMENLPEDFKRVCNIIGIPYPGLPHKNESKHPYYKECYNETTKELVREHFQPDLDLFDYDF